MIKAKFYSHTSKEDNYYDGKDLNLTEAQLENYCYTGYEIAFDIEIDDDGHAWATHVNGVELKSRVRI